MIFSRCRRPDFLLVDVHQFNHIDPKGIGDINEFGKVETVLAGLVVGDERFGFAKARREFCVGEMLGVTEVSEDSTEDGKLIFVVSGHWVRSPWS